MVNSSTASLLGLAIHLVGNKVNEGKLNLSKSLIPTEEKLASVLIKFATEHFKDPEFFRFTYHNDEIELNPIFNFVSNIFDNEDFLLEESTNIAKHLFNQTNHTNIKDGELYILHIKDVMVEDEICDAVAIIKSEEKEGFLKVDGEGSSTRLIAQEGTWLKKIDKACLIINTDRDYGYKILNIDHLNKNNDAIYWRDDFLTVTPIQNSFKQTKDQLKLTADFIKLRVKPDQEKSRISISEMMTDTFEYFKNNEVYQEETFKDKVFKNQEDKAAFETYKAEISRSLNKSFPAEFEVSDYAVNKHSKVYKSIIKLDKNFHIYVHGDHSKIMKGSDENGKYYILYYQEES